MKQRRIIKALTATLIICILAAVLVGCGSSQDEYIRRIEELEEENDALKAQIEALSTQQGNPSAAQLKSWELTGTAWSGNNGATVMLTAVPVYYSVGQRASLLVTLSEEEVENIPAQWDGTAYTAAASLAAADGYCYYCVLTSPEGISVQIPLTSPTSPSRYELVFLEASLNAYCELILGDCQIENDQLSVLSGSVQIQLPRIAANDRIPQLESAVLSLRLGGEEIGKQELSVPQSETPGVFETPLEACTFPMPQMQNDSQLEMWLEVRLTDGRTIFSNGGTWYYTDGSLSMAVG